MICPRINYIINILLFGFIICVSDSNTYAWRYPRQLFPEDVPSDHYEAGATGRPPLLVQGPYISSIISGVIMNIVRLSPATNYRAKNPSDLFDFLRENYPEPGK